MADTSISRVGKLSADGHFLISTEPEHQLHFVLFSVSDPDPH